MAFRTEEPYQVNKSGQPVFQYAIYDRTYRTKYGQSVASEPKSRTYLSLRCCSNVVFEMVIEQKLSYSV